MQTVVVYGVYICVRGQSSETDRVDSLDSLGISSDYEQKKALNV